MKIKIINANRLSHCKLIFGVQSFHFAKTTDLITLENKSVLISPVCIFGVITHRTYIVKKIRVILADDYAILRYGISTLLSQAEDIEVVGEAAKGDECIELFKKMRPDVSIIDIGMPGKDGLEVTQAIRAIDPHAKVLIFSMHTEEEIIEQMLSINVNGFLPKNCPKTRVLQAIRSIADGNVVISRSIAENEQFAAQKDSDKTNITDRELEILKLVVSGLTSPQIAKKLFISRRTVDTHRNNLMQKLDIHNTATLVRYAIENQLVGSK